MSPPTARSPAYEVLRSVTSARGRLDVERAQLAYERADAMRRRAELRLAEADVLRARARVVEAVSDLREAERAAVKAGVL